MKSVPAMAIGAVVAALTAITALVLVPIPHPFQTVATPCGDLCMPCRTNMQFPQGSNVEFYWDSPKTVSFSVWACPDTSAVISQVGTSGSGSFVAAGGSYSFTSGLYPGGMVGVHTNVTGSWSLPLVRAP